MNQKTQTIILNIFAVVLIAVVSGIFIKDAYGIKIIGDEFGY